MRLEGLAYAGNPLSYDFHSQIINEFLSKRSNEIIPHEHIIGSIIDILIQKLNHYRSIIEIPKQERADIAASVLHSLGVIFANIAISIAQEKKIKYIGLSGGVAYNSMLNKAFYETLMANNSTKDNSNQFILLEHQNIPPGDAGISIGQAAVAIANFNKKNKKLIGLLVLMFLAFITPLALLGKIIYPRYLLPSSLFIILIASINLANLLSAKEKIYHILAGILTFLIVLHSGKFIFPSYFNIEQIPFSQADRVQYLEEWSSGQGIYDVSQLMLHTSQNQSLAVATEGFFGTLPDGILMYLHRQNVNNLLVEGIGQPIHAIPDDFLTKAKNYESLWLVVNSHRITMDTSHAQLIATYCRPNRAPCLQVWDMSYLLENN
jgi:hypothetical protein